MAQVAKIDSNITGLAYAEEADLGLLPGEGGLPGVPEWYRLSPNSYSDFGGSIVTVAPNPINPSRQRRKGVTTDLDASGGLNQNITFRNLTHLLQGVMFADIRRKKRASVTSTTASDYNVDDATGVFTGAIVRGAGLVNSANNTANVVTGVAGTAVTVDGALVAEATPPANAILDVVGVEGDFSITITGDFATLTSAGVDMTTLGLVPGQWIYIGGDDAGSSFPTAANNGFKRIRTVTAGAVTIDKSNETMVDEAGGAGIQVYYGDVLKNELGDLIKRRTYHIERTLGAPDNASPNAIQSEILVGAVANEFALNIPTADLMNADISFVAIDNQQRTAAEGPKQTDVQDFLAATEYNTSSDVNRIRLSIVSTSDEAPSALFAYVTDATLTVNNNVSPNKAVGVLGAFDVTAGTFAVSGSLTAYFASIEAVQAVRTNANVSLDMSFVKENTGLVVDVPLLSLGDGRLNVEVDQPINLPLSIDAARALDIDVDLDHTLLITYFNHLPDAAA